METRSVSVRALTDSGGQVVARYDYAPFCDCGGSNQATRRRTGQERDSESGLNYVDACSYESTSARCLAIDPVINVDAALIDPQRGSRYSYARSDPLVFTDPDGRDVYTAGAVNGKLESRDKVLRMLSLILSLLLGLQNPDSMSAEERAQLERQNATLRAMLEKAPVLPLRPDPIAVQPPSSDGWGLGMVSWIAADPNGLIYLLQRGENADPVIVIDRQGKIIRSWGKGLYTTPHAIRLDPQGNVWTTDAASSMVYKFSPTGELLMKIEVGGQPTPCGNFCSTTDIAFAPNGHLFIADGYRNARILEYSSDGKKLREWGSAGTGPGQFRLPHSIQIGNDGVVYVADRENGRIQRFDAEGKYLGEWSQYGKTFGLKLTKDAIWLSSIPRGPNGAPGWLIKVDPKTGKLLGYVAAQGNHGMDVTTNGDVMQAPGPKQIPQYYSNK
jgi:RHS repeat-associated protein